MDKGPRGCTRRELLKLFCNFRAPSGSPPPVPPAIPGRYVLNSLRDLPEPVLRNMVPMLREDLVVTVQNDQLAFQGSGGEAGAVPLSAEASAAVRLFDGQRTLAEIGGLLENDGAVKIGDGFRSALNVFLFLSQQGVSHPAGPPNAPVAETVRSETTAPPHTPQPAAPGPGGWKSRAGWLLFAAVLYLPLALVGGYGADYDSREVVAAGKSLFANHRYVPSRYPGYVVHELPAALLDHMGGAPLSNAATVLMSLWAIHSFLRILKLHAVPHRQWLALALIANPFYWAASTCTIDYVWALALLLAGYLAYREHQFGRAGVRLGLAMACRAASLVFILALFAAAALAGGTRRKSELRTCVFSMAFGAAFYLPTWLQYGRRRLYMGDWSWLDYAVRFVNGELAFFGSLALVPLVLGLLWAGRAGWRMFAEQPRESMLACAFIVLGYQALFVRYPFEEEYMLPLVPFFLVLLGFGLQRKRGALLAWLVLQTVAGFISVNLVALPARYAHVEEHLPALPGVALGSIQANRTRLDIGLFLKWGHLAIDVAARRHGLAVE